MNEEIISFLKTLVSFKSISAFKDNAKESRQAADFIKTKLEGLGATVNIVPNVVENKNGLILAKLGEDLNKKTILFYSHYDVQPASIEDGWSTDPFDLTEKDDGNLYGRGANDDKGPIAATYFAVKELADSGKIPVNVRWLYEGEEESTSGGFEDTVTKYKDFFGKIDGILVLDTSWFGDNVPSMDYGFRGITYMGIEIKGPNKDQHSGMGGTFREPLTDLIYIMSNLISFDGKVQIDGFYDKVKPLTPEEEKLYENIEFTGSEFKKYLGVDKLLLDDDKKTLLNWWRNPSLSLHGIQGAFSEPGSKTVIPGTVIGKVSMRLVPDQDPLDIEELFKKHIDKLWSKMGSSNKIEVRNLGMGNWWYGDFTNFLYKAGHEAIKEYWGIEPAYTRSGGSIPIIPFMEKTFNAPAMGLGIGQYSDGSHSQNEKLRIKNLIGGKEVIKKILQKL